MMCDDTDGGERLNREVDESTGLHCACHSCGWPSCPPACEVMKGAHQHERAKGARWGGWAHRSGGGVAVVVPSRPPGDCTVHDSKQSDTWRRHARSGQPPSGPVDGQPSWLARETRYRATDTSTQTTRMVDHSASVGPCVQLEGFTYSLFSWLINFFTIDSFV